MSRLSTIISEAEAVIAAMTQDDGYNNDWTSVNEFDANLAGAFPQAIVDVTDEVAEELDVHAGAYTLTANLTVTVRDANTGAETYPQRALRTKLYADLDDLKKCFGGPAIESAFNCEYQGFTITPTAKGDVHTSAEMVVSFVIRYTQDRTNPANPAC